MDKQERKKYIYAVLFSLLVHVVIILLLQYDLLFPSPAIEQPPQPMTLIFEQPKPVVSPEPALPEQFYELEENPNATQEIPEQTNILSTANSRSAAPDVERPGTALAPRTTLKKEAAAQKEEAAQPEIESFSGKEAIYAFKNFRRFSKQALGQPDQSEAETKDQQTEEGFTRVQRDFQAESVGDFALSTYQWDWAPYWLAFKKKLMRLWYAPPAYYKLGLIYGYTIVRFKVNRAGEMFDFQVLQHVGHHSLEESSVSAIRSCFPFQPLPEDFPDEYLEVTIKMVYPNLRALSAQN